MCTHPTVKELASIAQIYFTCPPYLNCRFHCAMEFPGLLSWALAQKLTVYRAVLIMARGTYEHAWPGCGLVVTPSGMGW